MDIQQDGIALQKAWEGFKPTKYPDGNGYSIGFGTHIDTAGEQYLLNAKISEVDGEILLLNDNRKQFIPTIQKYIKVPLTQRQFHGLLDLVYNVGPQCLYISGKTTGLCNAINSQDTALIVAKFRAYNKVRNKQGVISASTYQTKRREADVQMFLYGKIVKPDGTIINPVETGSTIVSEENKITLIQYILGAILVIGGGVLAYKQGIFKNFSVKKIFTRK